MKKILFILLFTFIFSISLSSAAILDDIIANYKLDELSGARVNSSTNSIGTNNGTIATGNLVSYGKINGGYNNNGGYISLSNQSHFNLAVTGARSMAISTWLNVTSGNDGYIFARDNGVNTAGIQYRLRYDATSVFFSTGQTGEISTAHGSSNTWVHIVATSNETHQSIYVNGVLSVVGALGAVGSHSTTYIGRREANSGTGTGLYDEIGIWNKTLTQSEVTILYNSGLGLQYPFVPNSVSVNLTSPANATVIADNNVSFIANYSVVGYNMTNVTYFIWYTNSTIFNQTNVQVTGNSTNSTILNISGLNIGNYKWNVNLCVSNITGQSVNCSFWATSNFTFQIGASGIFGFNATTVETANEGFTTNISILSGTSISSAFLWYNGIKYSGTNVNLLSSTLYSVSKSITIPLNSNPFANSTNSWMWEINYIGGTQQNLTTQIQNASFINLQLCNATYPTKYINFTILDELNQSIVNSDFQTTFNYYSSTGDGSVYKNYSINNVSHATNDYTLCFGPNNRTITVSGDVYFVAPSYSPNVYSLSEAQLNSSVSQVNLYLLPLASATKFYITVKQGVEFLQGVIVQVAKLFAGTDAYNTVSIRTTDDNAQFPMYMDIDGQYQFTITEDGSVLGIIFQSASCSATPCSMTLVLPTDSGNAFEGYDSTYANGILSNLSFDATTKIVTYQFIDTTGLAQYFRLLVSQVSYNTTAGSSICDTQVFSSSGSITCNVSGYNGDFYAYGYIARSPEKIDKFISFVIDTDLLDELGLFAVFITFAVLLTGLFAAVTFSRGNPSTVITVLGVLILALKFAHLFPFSWTVVITLEALIIFILFKLDN